MQSLITAIAIALTNSRISQLWVRGCGITLTGARSMATLLLAIHSVSTSVLLGNPIHTYVQRELISSYSQHAVNMQSLPSRYKY